MSNPAEPRVAGVGTTKSPVVHWEWWQSGPLGLLFLKPLMCFLLKTHPLTKGFDSVHIRLLQDGPHPHRAVPPKRTLAGQAEPIPTLGEVGSFWEEGVTQRAPWS